MTMTCYDSSRSYYRVLGGVTNKSRLVLILVLMVVALFGRVDLT